MARMALQVWSLLLLTAPGIGPALVLSACPQGELFWDDCNLCWCRDGVVACSDLRCVGQPPVSLSPPPAPYLPPGGPPPPGWPMGRDGVIAYKPGRGRVRSRGRPRAPGWTCQFSSSWLEAGGCVHCTCRWGGKISCEDSGLCKDGRMEPDSLENAVGRWRRSLAEEPPAPAPASPTPIPSIAPSPDPATTPTPSPSSAPTPNPAPGHSPSTPPRQVTTGPEVSTQEPVGPALATDAPPALGITAQATVVKERSCKSGSTWEEECNTCWCLDDGKAACTSHRCGDPAAALPLGAEGLGNATGTEKATAAGSAHNATAVGSAAGSAAGATDTTNAAAEERVENATAAAADAVSAAGATGAAESAPAPGRRRRRARS